MATRSRIGVVLPSGSILSAYHHWGGYPEGLGVKLKKSYTNFEDILNLISGGDMSTIGEPYSNRGEDCPPRLDCNSFVYTSDSEEYSYLWEDNAWKCFDNWEEVWLTDF